jgi:hypothetical protein
MGSQIRTRVDNQSIGRPDLHAGEGFTESTVPVSRTKTHEVGAGRAVRVAGRQTA